MNAKQYSHCNAYYPPRLWTVFTSLLDIIPDQGSGTRPIINKPAPCARRVYVTAVTRLVVSWFQPDAARDAAANLAWVGGGGSGRGGGGGACGRCRSGGASSGGSAGGGRRIGGSAAAAAATAAVWKTPVG